MFFPTDTFYFHIKQSFRFAAWRGSDFFLGGQKKMEIQHLLIPAKNVCAEMVRRP